MESHGIAYRVSKHRSVPRMYHESSGRRMTGPGMDMFSPKTLLLNEQHGPGKCWWMRTE